MAASGQPSRWQDRVHLQPLQDFWESLTLSRRHFLVSILLSIVVLGVSLGVTTNLILVGVDDRIPFTGSQAGLLDGSLPQISLIADFLRVDTDARTVTVDWYPLATNCSFPETVANIYADPNLIVSDGGDSTDIASSDPPSKPVFTFNSTESCNSSNRNSFNVFRTMFKLTGRASSNSFKLDRESLQAYPFDEYIFQISMYASLASTNESVAIILDKSFGVPVNFDIHLNEAASSNNDQGILLSFVASRSGAVVVLVVIMMAANWLVTLAFLWITTAAFFWKDEIVTEMFVLPIGALFAFTSVRANLPGAPTGFGAIVDYYGILPNLALMTLFGAILLFRVLLSRIDGSSPPPDKPLKSDKENQSFEKSPPPPEIAQLTTATQKLEATVAGMDAQLTTAIVKLGATVEGLQGAVVQLIAMAPVPVDNDAPVEAGSAPAVAPVTDTGVAPAEVGPALDTGVLPPASDAIAPETGVSSTNRPPEGNIPA